MKAKLFQHPKVFLDARERKLRRLVNKTHAALLEAQLAAIASRACIREDFPKPLWDDLLNCQTALLRVSQHLDKAEEACPET